MIKKTLLLTLLISVKSSLFSQNLNYSALLIPKELKENANAVVRNNYLEVIIDDMDKMIVKRRIVVTVLNKLGQADARISESYDNDTKITDLSAYIYDALGNQIKKYKERDFSNVSAVDGGTLYSDARVKYIDYKPISYPYTLVFESEYKTGTTGFIPWWFPVNGYYVSVQQSSYKISNPKAIPWRKKETNFENFNIEKTVSDTEISYSLKNQKAFDYEKSTVSSREFLPKVKVALDKFYLKGVYGEYTNWNEFGKWMYDKLLVGRDLVDETTKNKVLSLVEGVENPIERAKIVYKFMQNKTRYISVQVGIGGWEPIAANQVDKVGYGDCKGLTNYTKALLDIAGVTSYYTVVYAQEKRNIDKDFSSIQGNHVILNLPNSGKDVWLECTSQTMPFGFLGDFTDDRDVLVVTPEGGVIKRTAAYKDDVNLQITKATITLTEKGNVKAKLDRISKGIQYDDKFYLEDFSKDELIKYYKSDVWSYNNNLEVVSSEVKNDKDSIVFKENLEVDIKNYASINENEYLFRVNIFNRESYVPKRYRTRNLPLKINRGYKDIDDYTIKIPADYKIEYLPETREIKSKFGSYKIRFKKVDESTFTYHKDISIKEGVYPKEDYKSYRSFRRKVAKSENLRIAIIKKKS
ncbi:DUF3857 domain-containing protein [Polaribacter porphyrae]|uniref:DUF3857 domain-containing protein n=1 Tax=Polaribacter porphyrae TaxID=1137780 RepID=A0A2S7WPY9_9FLAO|nr:DUF3857 domain-containing protein [Polaribacter porphyrae]PQJ79382.1 DUF3857 domain-containing protein [Polaribacter porphyrae]